MSAGSVILILICLLLLAVIGAFRVSRSVFGSLSKRGSGWAWTGGTLSFILSFALFFTGMALVFGTFFGR